MTEAAVRKPSSGVWGHLPGGGPSSPRPIFHD